MFFIGQCNKIFEFNIRIQCNASKINENFIRVPGRSIKIGMCFFTILVFMQSIVTACVGNFCSKFNLMVVGDIKTFMIFFVVVFVTNNINIQLKERKKLLCIWKLQI